MATINNKTQCSVCNEHKITYPCQGCANQFCYEDLAQHRQKLNEDFDEIIRDYEQFRENIHQQKQIPRVSHLFYQIDQWETNSIEIIQQTAERCRQALVEKIKVFVIDIEEEVNNLISEIKQFQRENEVNEMNLEHLKDQLGKIANEFNNPSTITLDESSQIVIWKISIQSIKKFNLNIWNQNAVTIAGGSGFGEKLNQLSTPFGICIDKMKNVFIADWENDRVMKWKPNENQGTIVAGGNSRGERLDQLNEPTDVAVDEINNSLIIADKGNRRVVQWWDGNQQDILIDDIHCSRLAIDKEGLLYVSDWRKNEVRRWKIGEKGIGTVVAGGNGPGIQLNQLNSPCFIFVDDDQSVYVSDRLNHRVMKWRRDAREGIIVAGGNGQGDDLSQLSGPQGVVVDDFGQIYVSDCYNNRVMRWREGDEEGETVVGGRGEGERPHQLYCPTGLSFDADGNLYIVDLGNNRVQRFDLIFE
ncbi:unnamed protein product [Adineta ricciae]|uniref:Uncharacterized protein n=1 Tax=Adineta ricciae TaxID=249248 RepID=A0A815RGP7_ADIRI|nr:unnamed protein product [Adineta ricciae]CAF1475643.1 unnamed protein product [Adineta ricciae]